ncbi:MAG: glycosyltransferase family 2 protein [Cryomorphaceae bacterium]|nr:glycosyltransferase [Flavobacteriales bacterium]
MLNQYLRKYGIRPALFDKFPNEELGISVVIPASNEMDIHQSLSALYNCRRPDCAVEVVVIINASETDSEEVVAQNRKTYQACKIWEDHSDSAFRVLVYMENDMPKKHAGVGLARKIGMDETVRRFEMIGNKNGVIACFDADSQCEPNYLEEIYAHFRLNPNTPGCSIQFKHPTFGTEFSSKTYLGITYYELHLRYYNQALRATGFPHAFHTVGSSMAVRCQAYQKQGGMNRRQAGEDFYFLHKIIGLGNFTELNTTCVYPSPRPSNRVPFGTGKAINDYLEAPSKIYYSYNLSAFKYLKIFFQNIPEFYLNTPSLVTMGGVIPYVMIDFLNAYFFDERMAEIKRNSSGFSSFQKRFYRWFNAFMVLKFVHFVRDNAHPNVNVERAAFDLLREMNYEKIDEVRSLSDLLEVYRELDRQGKPISASFK